MKKIFLILFLAISGNFVYSQCSTEVVVDSVSVLPNGDVIVAWQASPDVGIVSYDIYMHNPFTTANDSLSSTNTATLFYIIPYDTIIKYQIHEVGIVANCGAGIGISPVGGNYHNTIELTQTINICGASVNLTWNAYNDFNSGVNVLYNVYVNINGGGFLLVGTTNLLTYTYAGLSIGTNYQFFVRAIENSGLGPFTSSSNLVNVAGNFLKNPSFLYLFTGTVIDSSQILVEFYVDTTADIKYYNIKRALSADTIFSTINTVTNYHGIDPFIEYYDESVDAKNNSYLYQIEAINQCNQTKIISNIGKTMLLTVSSDLPSATNMLSWNFYEGWQGNVKEYQIYRLSKNDLSYNLIASILASTTTNTYLDDVSNELLGTGEFCYKVLAIEDNTVHIDNLPMATSSSNEYCVKHEPFIYIGNAFEPLSLFNPTFKPSAIFYDLSTYLFSIYDRWGHKVFETNNRDEGWNGKQNNSGNNLPLGAYIYLLKFKTTNGDDFQKRGTVTLIR